jgi:hypothetical protein
MARLANSEPRINIFSNCENAQKDAGPALAVAM